MFFFMVCLESGAFTGESESSTFLRKDALCDPSSVEPSRVWSSVLTRLVKVMGPAGLLRAAETQPGERLCGWGAAGSEVSRWLIWLPSLPRFLRKALCFSDLQTP